MVKSLIDKLKKGARKAILLGTAVASIGLAACQLPGPNPVPNPTPAEDYLDIKGYLQDNESNSPRQGIVRLYDEKNSASQIKIKKVDLGTKINDYEVQTTPEGVFSVTLDKVVNSADNVYIQARSGTSANPTSYVRTVEFPSQDGDAGNVRVVPYPTSLDEFTKEQFKAFMDKINFTEYYDSEHKLLHKLLQKFPSTYLNNFKGVVIIKNNPDVTKGSFTDGVGGQISKILNKKDDLAKWYEKDSMNTIIRTDNITHNEIDSYLLNNYLVIEPDNSLGTYKVKETIYVIYGESSPGLIKLNPDYTLYDYIILHEGGHASSVAPFESNNLDGSGIIISPLLTVMDTSVDYTYSSVDFGSDAKADLKAAKLVNEDTYKARENLDDILGNDFYQ